MINVNEEEKAILLQMASRHKRKISDYLRYLFITDYESVYRLTDAGREALKEAEK
jgi:hypothetical protein